MGVYGVTLGPKAGPLSWQPRARTSLFLASLSSLASGVEKSFVQFIQSRVLIQKVGRRTMGQNINTSKKQGTGHGRQRLNTRGLPYFSLLKTQRCRQKDLIYSKAALKDSKYLDRNQLFFFSQILHCVRQSKARISALIFLRFYSEMNSQKVHLLNRALTRGIINPLWQALSL